MSKACAPWSPTKTVRDSSAWAHDSNGHRRLNMRRPNLYASARSVRQHDLLELVLQGFTRLDVPSIGPMKFAKWQIR